MTKLPLKYILLRYAGMYLLSAIIVAVAAVLIENYFQIDLGYSTVFAAIFFSAFDAGSTLYKKTGQRLDSGLQWRLSAYLTAVNTMISLAILVPFIISDPKLSAAYSSGFLVAVVLIVLVIVTLLSWVMTKFSLNAGMKLGENRDRANSGSSDEDVMQ